MTTKWAVLTFLAAAGLAAPASAATPESGSVSTASPVVEWKGETTMGGLTTIPAVANGSTLSCVAPTCETFALQVVDSNDLTVTARSDGGRVFVLVEILKPDGTVVYNGGTETDDSTTVKIKKAPAGAYEVRVANNAIEPEPYSATATLGVPAAAPAPVTTAQPGAPSPAPQPSVTLGLKTKKISARRSKQAAKLAVTSTGPVTDLTATLRRGRKVVGTGKLAKLDKAGTVKIKARKLKPGTYTLQLAGKDTSGRAVALSARLKVTR